MPIYPDDALITPLTVVSPSINASLIYTAPVPVTPNFEPMANLKPEREAPLIVLAIGQISDFDNLGVTLEDLKSPTYQIKGSNVFYAGDIAPGDKTVVYSVKTGKEVCKAVMSYLGGAK